MIDKKLNVYYIHRETNEIYWNNLAWGEVGRIGRGMVAVLSLSETRQIVENRIAVEPNDHHIILGAVLEVDRMIDVDLSELEYSQRIRNLSNLIFDKFMPSKMSKSQYEVIKKHYEECEK